MPFDEGLAQRIREHLLELDGLSERRMFGGLCFMVDGNMIAGILGDELLIRVGAENHAAALKKPHAREMDFTGRPMRGMVIVGTDGFAEDRALGAWLDGAITFVRALGPRAPKQAAKTAAKKTAAKKTVAKKTAAKKTVAKKAVAKKTRSEKRIRTA